MKLKLFEYVILLHPEDSEGNEIEKKTLVLKEVTRVLSKDEKQVGILAARDIPTAHLDNLDRIEILVRPF